MKMWKKLIFVFIAYAITLTHTIVPHQHTGGSSGSMLTVAASMPDSLGGFLQKLFSTDLGCGHLEKFQRSADTDFDFSLDSFPECFSFDAFLFAAPERKSTEIIFGSYLETLHNPRLLLGSSHLRAPPGLV